MSFYNVFSIPFQYIILYLYLSFPETSGPRAPKDYELDAEPDGNGPRLPRPRKQPLSNAGKEFGKSEHIFIFIFYDSILKLFLFGVSTFCRHAYWMAELQRARSAGQADRYQIPKESDLFIVPETEGHGGGLPTHIIGSKKVQELTNDTSVCLETEAPQLN
jgi:hypothetical protein